MIWVILLCGFFWGLGVLMRVPVSRRLVPIGIVLAGVLAAHFVLPAGHPLVLRLGGTFAGWATALGALGLIGLYGLGVAALKRRAPDVPVARSAPAPAHSGLSDVELARYARHIVMPDIGGPGQRALHGARVLVVGAGGLGSPVLMYLAAAGVGRIGVVDDDRVDGSNLGRQVIHRDADIGMLKVESAAAAMRAQNPSVRVERHALRLDADAARALFAGVDLVLDGSDNFDTRYMVNRVAAGLGKPVISGALSQWEGQVSLWHPGGGGPCYECVFPEPPAPGLVPSCAQAGVLGPLPGVIGSMMAVEAVKWIVGAGAPLLGRILIYDALYGEVRVIGAKPRGDCPVCGARA